MKTEVVTCDRCKRPAEVKFKGSEHSFRSMHMPLGIHLPVTVGDQRISKSFDLCSQCLDFLDRWLRMENP